MSDYLLRWPAIPLEFNSSMSRRAENLNDVENTVSDDEGLIECAILPLRDVVLYPNLLTPLFVVHEPTILAIEHATRKNETVIALAQIEASIEDPSEQDLYRVGTEIAIGRIMTVPDGSASILTQGRRRVEIVEIIPGEYLRARARPIEEPFDEGTETLALMRAVTTLFEKCVQLNRSLPEEAFL